jgi:hypothetical protein
MRSSVSATLKWRQNGDVRPPSARQGKSSGFESGLRGREEEEEGRESEGVGCVGWK